MSELSQRVPSTEMLLETPAQSGATSPARAIGKLMLVIGILLLLVAVATVAMANGAGMSIYASQAVQGVPEAGSVGRFQISQPVSLLLLGCGLLSIAIAIRRMPLKKEPRVP